MIVRPLERAADNVDGRIPGMLQAAGFEPVTQVEHFGWLTGIVSATKPSRTREVR